MLYIIMGLALIVAAAWPDPDGSSGLLIGSFMLSWFWFNWVCAAVGVAAIIAGIRERFEE